MKLINSKRK